MLVVKKVNNMVDVLGKRASTDKITGSSEGILRGIRCRWFTTDGHMQEEIFNTKDLELVN